MIVIPLFGILEPNHGQQSHFVDLFLVTETDSSIRYSTVSTSLSKKEHPPLQAFIQKGQSSIKGIFSSYKPTLS